MLSEPHHHCFRILEVNPDASLPEIQRSYLHLKRLYTTESLATFPIEDELNESKEEILEQIEAAYAQLITLFDTSDEQVEDEHFDGPSPEVEASGLDTECQPIDTERCRPEEICQPQQPDAALTISEPEESFKVQRKLEADTPTDFENEAPKLREPETLQRQFERTVRSDNETGYKEDSAVDYWHSKIGDGLTRREFYMEKQKIGRSIKSLFFAAILIFLLGSSMIFMFPENIYLSYVSLFSFSFAFSALYFKLVVLNYRLAKALRKNAPLCGGISLLFVPGVLIYLWLMNHS